MIEDLQISLNLVFLNAEVINIKTRFKLIDKSKHDFKIDLNI